MTARRAETGDDDVIAEPTPREAYRVQVELLRVLHADSEARTRIGDGRRGIMDHSVPFVIGILIGALGTYAGIAGRMATQEEKLSTVQVVTRQQAEDMKEVRGSLSEVLVYVRSQQAGSPTRKQDK